MFARVIKDHPIGRIVRDAGEVVFAHAPYIVRFHSSEQYAHGVRADIVTVFTGHRNKSLACELDPAVAIDIDRIGGAGAETA